MDDKVMQQEDDQSLVVGIGASAGGLEALQEFFNYCPADMGVSFVVVQHLSPDFKSMMDQLLSRCTDMPVKVAEDGEMIRSNHVYLIPPRKSMIVAQGSLLLTDAAPHVSLSLPIDTFFRSLAEDQQHRSVGIILSGTGSDGSRGIAGIKEVGGLVLVQDPAEAKFDGMPNAALSSNYVDYKFKVEEMPEYLAGYKRSLYTLVGDEQVASDINKTTSVLDEICSTVQKHVHINLQDYKRSTIARRIDKRASLHQLSSWPEYLVLLKESSEEQSALGKEILIGVTSFFRDKDAFDNFQKKMIPEVLDNSNLSDEIRVWCAGCSTGEEAYSMAICFEEAMAATGKHRAVKIFATDIDANAVHEASLGHFGEHISDEMPGTILAKYFTEQDGGYEIKTKIRQMVVFAVHNVISDPPFSNMDLVLCRNLLIYLGNHSQQRVQQYLNFALKKDGFLTLGPSKSLIADLASCYTEVDRRYKQFKKIKVERKLLETGNLAYKSDMDRRAAARAEIAAREPSPRDLYGSVFKDLSEAFSPATLVFNSRQELVYSIGDCEPYTRKLAPGPSSLKVDSILEQSLLVAVTTAMQKAKREQRPITYAGVTLPDESVVDLSVRYTNDPVAVEEYLLVSFSTAQYTSDTRVEEHAPVQFDEKQMLVSRIEDLEYELQQSRANLAVTVEELETSNEELQSTNEELMAANEELQSTNEELQSVNEELFSVNSEYQHKVLLLEETTADFENLLKNPSVSLIALDRDFTIKHFSPSVTEFFKLRHTDLDRSIEDISHDLGPAFAEDCKKVMSTEVELMSEYRAGGEKILLARFTPYRDIHDQINGVVVSFTDIGDSQIIKREKDALVSARAVLDRQHEQLASTLNPLMSSGETADLRVLLVEDDPADAEILSKFLEESDLFKLRLETCSNLATAEEIYRAGSFDVIFMDYQLQGENAKSAIEDGLLANSPIILLTGLDKNDLPELRTKNVYDYVRKDSVSTSILEKSLHLTLQSFQVARFLEQKQPAS